MIQSNVSVQQDIICLKEVNRWTPVKSTDIDFVKQTVFGVLKGNS